MAFSANRNHIKPMFFFITFVVVVLFSRFCAHGTLKSCNFRHLSKKDGVMNSRSSLKLQREFLFVSVLVFVPFFALLQVYFADLIRVFSPPFAGKFGDLFWIVLPPLFTCGSRFFQISSAVFSISRFHFFFVFCRPFFRSNQITRFALRRKAVFFNAISVKIRNAFLCLAIMAIFCIHGSKYAIENEQVNFK